MAAWRDRAAAGVASFAGRAGRPFVACVRIVDEVVNGVGQMRRTDAKPADSARAAPCRSWRERPCTRSPAICRALARSRAEGRAGRLITIDIGSDRIDFLAGDEGGLVTRLTGDSVAALQTIGTPIGLFIPARRVAFAWAWSSRHRMRKPLAVQERVFR